MRHCEIEYPFLNRAELLLQSLKLDMYSSVIGYIFLAEYLLAVTKFT